MHTKSMNEKKEEPSISSVREGWERFASNVGKVIVGKEETIRLMFVALMCEGHVLIEDLPGVGKTQLAKASSSSLGCSFKRIQCTPDLLPSDITGVQYFNQKTCEFEFHNGPIMANIVLVDEINRAMPRTQSCLLECMEERQLTVDLDTVQLKRPFMIIATQNPIELEGTFPLPEAQLDRFLFRIRMGYPSLDEETEILNRFQEDNPVRKLASILSIDELVSLQSLLGRVFVESSVRDYILAINRETRKNRNVRLGASPRASLGLQQASRVLAAIEGREYVTPDDVKSLAVPTLAHRIILTTDARLKGSTEDEVVAEIVSNVPVPTEVTKR